MTTLAIIACTSACSKYLCFKKVCMLIFHQMDIFFSGLDVRPIYNCLVHIISETRRFSLQALANNDWLYPHRSGQHWSKFNKSPSALLNVNMPYGLNGITVEVGMVIRQIVSYRNGSKKRNAQFTLSSVKLLFLHLLSLPWRLEMGSHSSLQP